MPDWNEKIIAEFRATGGKVGGVFEGASLILLTTIGARTGAHRTTPVVYLRDGDRILVFASNLGAETHPNWYHNLLANPEVTVETGDGTYPATAHPLAGEERDRRYARQAELDPAFAAYQATTSRVIPVVALYRRDPARARALSDELVRIHGELRQQMASLLSNLDLPAPSLGAQLRERCLSYCDAVHSHHVNESTRGFPLLEQRFPELAPTLEQLRREHDVLARIRRDVEQTLATSTGTHQVRTELRRLASELDSHFTREEEHLAAALNAL